MGYLAAMELTWTGVDAGTDDDLGFVDCRGEWHSVVEDERC